MVIYIKQLDGKNVKKSLNVHRVGKQWYNKIKAYRIIPDSRAFALYVRR